MHADVEPCDLIDADAAPGPGRAAGGAASARVAGVCNNAGFGTVANLLDAGVEREQRVVALNVDAVHHLTGAFLEPMVAAGAGAILNVASTAAFQPLPGFATYAASKAFVQSFSEARARRAGGHGRERHLPVPRLHAHGVRGARAGAGSRPRGCRGSSGRTPARVARAGVEGMIAGRRTVVPGLHEPRVGARRPVRAPLDPPARRQGG